MPERSGVLLVTSTPRELRSSPPLSDVKTTTVLSGDAALFQFPHDAADALVQAPGHGGVGGIAMMHGGLERPVEANHVGRLGLDGRVYGVVREIEEERPLARLVDHAQRFVGEPVGQVLAGLAEFESGT